MDFANRGNRPTQTPQQNMGQSNEQPSQSFQPMGMGDGKDKKRGKGGGGSKLAKVGAIFMLFALAALVVAVLAALVFGGDAGKDESDLIDTSKYQAVFLDSQDGQVYFGRLEVYNQRLYRLTDIFYVRVEQPIQPEGQDQQQQANISLAKLGNELHGPQDAMYIARDKVLYWENLKEDGQVVTAITEFIKNGRQTPDTTQQQTEDATQQTQPTGTEEETDTPTDTTEETPTP